MAGTRLVVQDTLFDRTVQHMKQAADKLKVGNGQDDSCQMGPLASQEQLERVMSYIEVGKKEGRLITAQRARVDKGFFIAPTIFTALPNAPDLCKKNFLGTVLVIQKSLKKQGRKDKA